MRLGPMTRRWLVTIVIAIVLVLIAVWLYTAFAAEEVEPEVGLVSSAVIYGAPLDPGPPPPTPPPTG
jgi:hypothetical protein